MTKKYSTSEIKNMIMLEAAKQGVPAELALAVAQHESGFNNLAKSPKNTDGSRDHGVFQLNDKYHKLKNVYDPIENIAYGIRHLKGLLAGAKGDVRKALSDYNAGANATGKGRKQGDAYAQKVMAIMNKGDNKITGAAAPVPTTPEDIGERMADLVAGNVNLAQQGIQQYASQPYDPSVALALRVQRQKEYEDMLNKIVRETPIAPTAEQIAAANQPFNQNVQNMQAAAADALQRVQNMADPSRVQDYEKRLRDAYEQQIQRLQEANPYTQLAQKAPLQIDSNQLQGRQGLDRATASIANVYGVNPINTTQNLINEAQQQRMAQAAAQTGLTPEEFIAGGTADYNSMMQALAAQNQQLANLYARAQQGDVYAIQAIQGITNNLVNQMQQGTASQATAQHQLRADQLAAAKENRERYFDMLKQIQGLDPNIVNAGADIQKQNIGTAGSMFNTGLSSGTQAAGNLGSYEAKIATGGQDDAVKAPTPQQVISTMGQVAGMSNDPNAIQNWQQGAAQAYSAAGVPDAYILPFLQQNTFRPQQ